MSFSGYFPNVAPARPAAIDDRQLATLTQLAHDARNGICSPAEAEWVLSTAGALFEELSRYRAGCRRAGLVFDGDNIVRLVARGEG